MLDNLRDDPMCRYEIWCVGDFLSFEPPGRSIFFSTISKTVKGTTTYPTAGLPPALCTASISQMLRN